MPGRPAGPDRFEERTTAVPDGPEVQQQAQQLRERYARQINEETGADIDPYQLQTRYDAESGEIVVRAPSGTRREIGRQATAAAPEQPAGPGLTAGDSVAEVTTEPDQPTAPVSEGLDPGTTTPQDRAYQEARQGVIEKVQERHPGFDPGEEFVVQFEETSSGVRAEAELTERGERFRTKDVLWRRKAIDPRNVVFERDDEGDLVARVDPEATGRNSLRERSQTTLSPAVRLVTPEDQLAQARSGERYLARQAAKGDLAAQVYQGGEAIQHVGTDVQGATEEALPFENKVVIGGYDVGGGVERGVGMIAGGPFLLGGSVAQTPVAVGGTAGQVAGGRSVEDVAESYVATRDTGFERTGEKAISDPAAAATLLAAPYAARGIGRATVRGAGKARSAAETIARTDAETVIEGAKARGRAAANRARLNELRSDTRAQLYTDGGQRLVGRQRGRQGGRQRGTRTERVRPSSERATSEIPIRERIAQRRQIRQRAEDPTPEFNRPQQSPTERLRGRGPGGEEIVTRSQAESVGERLGMSRAELLAQEIGRFRGEVRSSIARRQQSQLVEGGRVSAIQEAVGNYGGPSPTARVQLRSDAQTAGQAGQASGATGLLSEAQQPQVTDDTSMVISDTARAEPAATGTESETTGAAPIQDVLERVEEAEQVQVTESREGPAGTIEDTEVWLDPYSETGAGQRQREAQRAETRTATESILDSEETGVLDRAETGVQERVDERARERTRERTRSRTRTAVDVTEDTAQGYDVPPWSTDISVPEYDPPWDPPSTERPPPPPPPNLDGGGGPGGAPGGLFSTEGTFPTGFAEPSDILGGSRDDGKRRDEEDLIRGDDDEGGDGWFDAFFG